MFVIAYDLNTEAANEHHPRKSRGAYHDLRRTLEPHGFRRVQGSTFVSDHEDLSQLYVALVALHRLEWLGECLKNIRVFRMEPGADFTAIFKAPAPTQS